ncbi:hypothetical protein Rsub_10858 [Raphidocelis subcapitata]|uniref:Uncharacterized protein n=1 Tax=Raphidocelis subcapitata TaxID=307507 RepID=A0A2V0PGH4_9CHLO|nr:hypothetical protein Rsub_10858 [Raphidocelis subcapitata]|eukprot:GBF98112.1 hypothetical protein Rsub_10858 [Raphidocelis subcapitata]
MSPLRRLGRLATAVAAQGRAFSAYSVTPNQLAGKTHGSGTADKVGLFVMLPTCAAFVGYDLLYPEEEFEGKIPHYPYLHIRTRERYPWGDDRGPFEHHRFIGGDDH